MSVNLGWRKRGISFADAGQELFLSADPRQDLYLGVLNASLSGVTPELAITGSFPGFQQLIRENDPVFIARLAIYMLEELHDRQWSFMLSAALALRMDNHEALVSLADRVIQQPASIGLWWNSYAAVYRDWHGKTIKRPGRQVRKLLAPVFNRLNEYQYIHYNRVQQAAFINALIRIKPAPRDREQKVLFGRILKDQLAVIHPSWQEELDTVRKQHYDNMGLKKAALKNKWEELILSWKIGYTELLENLPALLKAGIGGRALKLLAQYLANAGAVAKNGLTAIHYLEAYRQVKASGHHRMTVLLEALEKAAILSAGNIQGFTGDNRVVVAMDVSNSMKISAGDNRLVNRFDIGPLLWMSLEYRSRRVSAGLFGNTWKPVKYTGNKLLEAVEEFGNREGEVGFAANGWLVIRELINKNQVTDTVMLFTDCPLWNSRQPNQQAGTDIGRLWRQYKQIAPHARLLLFDLAAYGKSPVEVLPDDVCLVQGWNDRIFTVLDAIGKGMTTVEKTAFTISF